MLATGLEQHPDIHMAGEIVHHERFGAQSLPLSEYLDREVFSTDRKAAGFTIHHYQLIQYDAWDYLTSIPDLDVIYLERLNWFDIVVSGTIAMKTGIWRLDKGSPPYYPPFRIEPEYCERDFEYFASRDVEARGKFWKNENTTFTYEFDLCGLYPLCMMELQMFLDVPYHKIARPKTIKQAALPSHKQVSNYDELREHFKDTKYTDFFRGV